MRREAANRVTIYCWYQRRCDGGGVEGVDAPSPRQLSLPLPRQNEQELLYDSHSTGVYAWDASLDADTAITGKRMVVYLVRTPPSHLRPCETHSEVGTDARRNGAEGVTARCARRAPHGNVGVSGEPWVFARGGCELVPQREKEGRNGACPES